MVLLVVFCVFGKLFKNIINFIKVLGVMLFLLVARKKRANQGTYSPSTQEMTGTKVHIGKDKIHRTGFHNAF